MAAFGSPDNTEPGATMAGFGCFSDLSQKHLILRHKKSSAETATNRASGGDFLKKFLRQSAGINHERKEIGADVKFVP